MNDRNFLLFCTVHVYFLAEPLSSLNSPERCDEQPLNVTLWDPGVGKCSVCWTFIKEVSHWTLTIMLTLGHTCKFKPPPCYKVGGGGGGWTSPRVLDMLHYFKTILPSVENLQSSLQDDEVYFMAGGAAGGLWWHQQWLPSWPPSWNLPRISNHVKTARNGDFLCLTSKITHKQALCMILATRFTFIVEKTCTFTQKWLHHLLLIMSCLITIETDHYWTWLKMRVRDERTATEKIRCWCFIR